MGDCSHSAPRSLTLQSPQGLESLWLPFHLITLLPPAGESSLLLRADVISLVYLDNPGCVCVWVLSHSVIFHSWWPHGLQPTRLPHPWDSQGKNTGVGCHFLLQCMKVRSGSEVAQSCLTLSDPMDCGPPGSSIHGIFQARVLEWGAIALSGEVSSSLLISSYA